MRCRTAHRLASRRLDAPPPPAVAAALTRHLAGCLDCARFAARLESSWQELADAAFVAPPTPDLFAAIVERAERRRSRWRLGLDWLAAPRPVASAAVLTAFVALGLGLGALAARPLAPPSSPRALPFEARLVAEAFADVPASSPVAALASSLETSRGGR